MPSAIIPEKRKYSLLLEMDMLTVTLTNDQVTPQLIPAIYASTQIILSLIRTPANQDLRLAEMLNSGRHMQVHLCILFQRKYCIL